MITDRNNKSSIIPEITIYSRESTGTLLIFNLSLLESDALPFHARKSVSCIFCFPEKISWADLICNCPEGVKTDTLSNE
jgi:hypothetical protein